MNSNTDNTDRLARELVYDVARYIHELDNQSPIVNDSHVTLRRLWDKHGREKVKAELARQFSNQSK